MRTRRWARWGLGAGATLAALSVTLLLCATWRPAWYQPAALDAARLTDDKRALLKLVDDISAALNAGRAIEARLSDEQVNRWLAARDELPFELGAHAPLPEGPYVGFLEDGAIRLAATFRALGGGVVASIDVQVTLDREVLRVTLTRARAGALPIPPGLLVSYARAWLEHGPDSAAVKTIGPTLERRNQWMWTNGKRKFRVMPLSGAAGELVAELAPLTSE